MEKFVVSARKYRPSTFDSVVGQQSITNTLKNAIKTGHLAQAFLFCGSRGVGKTTCARILAKTINCSKRTDNIEACNECDSCKSFNEGNSLNILEMDGASNNSVDNIRELTDQVRFAPQIGDYKVYIIDEVHMLSASAFNAFLKTLEEPPAHAIFILATTEKHKIIPTILSRCQIFDFNRIRVEDITKHLAGIAEKESITAEEEALHIIAQKADGALRDALSMFDQLVSFSGKNLTYDDVIRNLNILDYDYYFRCTDIIREGNIPASLLLFDEIKKRGFDGHLFINGLASHLRNLLVCQDAQTLELLEAAPSVKNRYQKQAAEVKADFLLKALDICRNCDNQYKGSKNQRLLVELTLMQLASLSNGETAEKKKHQIKSHLDLPSVENSLAKAEKPQETKEVASKNTASPEVEPPTPPKEIQSTESLKATESPLPKESNEELDSSPTAEVKTPSEEKKKEALEKVDSAEKSQIKSDIKPGRTRSLSIHELTNEESLNDEEKEKEAFTSEDRNEFDQEKLEEVWEELANKIKSDKQGGSSMIFAGMTSRKPLLNEDYSINLLVDNKSQKEEIMLARTDLHDFLRKRLLNGAIEINIKVNKDQKQRKAYTDEEKFKEMAEKNPDILKLKEQLDLDFL